MLWLLKMCRGYGSHSWFSTTLRRTRRPRWIEQPLTFANPPQLQGTEDTELTLTREGDYIGSPSSNVEEINIFEGQFNRITFEQVYTKVFKCTYQLQLYPFDTQVFAILLTKLECLFPGVHSQPDCEEVGDFCDGDQPPRHQHGIGDGADPVYHHQLDPWIQECQQCGRWHPDGACPKKENLECHPDSLLAHHTRPHHCLCH